MNQKEMWRKNSANAIIPPSVTGCFLTKSKTVVLLRLLPEMFSQKLFFFVIDIETLICKQRPIGHLSMLNLFVADL